MISSENGNVLTNLAFITETNKADKDVRLDSFIKHVVPYRDIVHSAIERLNLLQS